MANVHGVKGRNWTPEEVDLATGMEAEGVHVRDIAQTLDRTVSSVEGKLRLVRNGPVLDRGAVPEHVPSDDRKHLKALYDANGVGFGWWPPSLMERVYLMERVPPRAPAFWRGEVRV